MASTSVSTSPLRPLVAQLAYLCNQLQGIVENPDLDPFEVALREYTKDFSKQDALELFHNLVRSELRQDDEEKYLVAIVKHLHLTFDLTKEDVRAYGEKIYSGPVNNNHFFRLSAENGHLSVMKYLKEEIGLIDDGTYFYGPKGYSYHLPDMAYTLAWSAGNGHLDIVKYLKEEFGSSGRQSLEITDRRGLAIRLSAANGHLSVVKYLKEAFCLTKEDVQVYCNQVLIGSAANGHLNVVKYLKEEFGLTKDDTQVWRDSALRISAGKGHLCIVKYLKEEFGLTKEDVQSHDNNALRWSCAKGHLGVVKYLMEEFRLTKEDVLCRGPICSLNASRISKYANAFVSSAINGHLDIVKYLKEECQLTKEDVWQVCGPSGFWATDDNELLGLSVANGHLSIVKFLNEEFGLTKEDVLDNGLLGLSARFGHLSIVKYLKKKVWPACGLTKEDARDTDNYALRWSAKNGHLTIVHYLKEALFKEN